MDQDTKETGIIGGAAAQQALSDGNQCIAWGLGVGGFGAATALALGATCPLCLVVAPGLVGMGILKRRSARRAAAQSAPASL